MLHAVALGLMFVAPPQVVTKDTPNRQDRSSRKEYSKSIDRALELGLRWLARQQNADGSFGPRRDQTPWKKPTGRRETSWIDPIAVWLFVVHGSDGESEYRKTAEKGLEHLGEAGLNPKEAGHGGPYLDIFPTCYYALGLGMIYARTKDQRILPFLKKAVQTIVERQKPIGGWNYSGPTDNTQNTVMTGTALCALVLAKSLGLDVPEKTMGKAESALLTTFEKSSGGFGYGSAGEGGRQSPDFKRRPNVARTGAALSALLGTGKGRSVETLDALAFLRKQFEGKPYFDYHGEGGGRGLPFHATQPLGFFHAAMALGLTEDKLGGSIFPNLVAHLLKHQQDDGSFQIGMEFSSKVGGDWRKTLAAPRDTCLALFALMVARTDGAVLKPGKTGKEEKK